MSQPELTDQDKIHMKMGELVLLVVELDRALARERGGGSPLSIKEYLDLHKRAREATFELGDVL